MLVPRRLTVNFKNEGTIEKSVYIYMFLLFFVILGINF